MHRKVELGIVPLDGGKEFIDTDFRVQFLPDLAAKCLNGALPRLNLATGGLPIVLPFAIAPLGGENGISFTDDGGNDFYCFHLRYNKV